MRRELRRVMAFTCAYLLIAFFFAFQRQNWEFVYYIAVVVLLGIAVFAVHRKAHLGPGVLWGLSLWGLLHMIGGLVSVPDMFSIAGDKRVFYSLWIIPEYLKYDHVIHAYGFGIATWLCWEALSSAFPGAKPTFGLLTLCVLGGMGLGAFNEVVEFMAVLLMPNTNVGGYVNTGWDLIANMVGASSAAYILWRRGHIVRN